MIKLQMYFQLRKWTVMLLCSFFMLHLSAQTIQFVPNAPTMSGYIGEPYIFNNSQVLRWHKDTTVYHGIYRVALFDGNNFITSAPAPDPVYNITQDYEGYPVTLKNKLYLTYSSISGSAGYYQLGVYDNNTVTLLPGNDANFQDLNQGIPTVYHNKLYYFERVANGSYRLASYDGSAFSFLPNPTQYGIAGGYFYIFNDKLFFSYATQNSSHQTTAAQLASYDGTILTLYPNPGTGGPIATYPFTEYHGKLIFDYNPGSNSYAMAQFDGNSISLVPGANSYQGGPIIYNDTFFFKNGGNLAKYDGTTVTIIANPTPGPGYTDYSNQPFQVSPVVFNNSLYIPYEQTGPYFKIAKYTGSGLELLLSPEINGGYFGAPIVYNNKLYFGYGTVTKGPHIGVFDGSSFSFIPDLNTPAGLYAVPYFSNFQNKLYFVYNNQLAFLQDAVLPVSFIQFNAVPSDAGVLLHWETAAEKSIVSYIVERSTDGIHFDDIGQQAASTGATPAATYFYTDKTAARATVSNLYYRIREQDLDGHSTLSSIREVQFSKNHHRITLFPNPATDYVSLISPDDITHAQITLSDVNGQQIFHTNTTLRAGMPLRIKISSYHGNMFALTIQSNGSMQTMKVVKE